MSMLLGSAAGAQHGNCTHCVQVTGVTSRIELSSVRLLPEALTL